MGSLRHHRVVRLIYLTINIPSSLDDRLVRHQDIPAECLEHVRDLHARSKNPDLALGEEAGKLL
jgi:hypothetical protein